MASKVETLELSGSGLSRPSVDLRHVLKAVADWFRRGQLGGHDSVELSRLTGGRC
jgi:hypothetical protein